ncbi:ankyrin repeat domain-containing protein [Qipengyuania sp. 6D47A]|uniref:Ankyrin repeat domain-containing protein n=2 Tax=Qipengyuania qiaonensis TaxID=2867240 RepID=A0ABS7J8A0_9SPHN|nr:ankyrin repeat domain-containing protein [Qipengyuania qiaonensis]MBX7483486.1 ankyrin repeat domain-containing protein [Qipengyuania qiaonensis]
MTSPLYAQSQSDGYKFLDAVKKREGDEVTRFLEQPGSILVNSRDITSGETALHVVTQRRDAVWLRFLLSKRANPNIADKNGRTPLQLAVQLGFAEGVEILADRGAAVDVPNSTGETPLITAVHRRDSGLVRLLIQKGASPDRADNSGRTARDYAKLMGTNSSMLEEIERAETDRGDQSESYGPS